MLIIFDKTMPVTSEHQAQIDFFLHGLLFQYFGASNVLEDGPEKLAKIYKISKFISKDNIDDKDIENFKELDADGKIFPLEAAILYIKTKDDLYIKGFSQELREINLKSNKIISPQVLLEDDLSYISTILSDLATKSTPFPNFEYKQSRPRLEIDDYSQLIHTLNPETSLIARSAVIDNHIIDQEVIDTIATKDKWRFLYHRVNSRETLDPRDNAMSDVWVVLAISPNNEVICLDPNGISADLQNTYDPQARNNAINAKKDILQIATSTIPGFELEDDIVFVDIESNRLREDSALSCGFAVQNLSKEIFIKNSSFDIKIPIIDITSTPIARAMQYAELLFVKELIQRFRDIKIDELEYVESLPDEDGNIDYELSSEVKDVLNAIYNDSDLISLSDEEFYLLKRIDNTLFGVVTPSDKEDFTILQNFLEVELYYINEDLKTHTDKYEQFQLSDIENSTIIPRPENKALNEYNKTRYDDARNMMQGQKVKKNTISSSDINKSLAKNLLKSYYETGGKKPKNVRLSGYYVDESNNMHLVKEEDEYHFLDPDNILTNVEKAEKSELISYNQKLHSFAPVENGFDGQKSIEFNEEKYKIDTTVFYFLGKISGENLKILQDKFPEDMEIADIRSKLQSAGSIKYFSKQARREQAKDIKDQDMDKISELEEKIENFKKELGEGDGLSNNDIRDFLGFRLYQANNDNLQDDVEQGLKDYINSSLAQRQEIPKAVAMNATVSALVDLKELKGQGDNYSNDGVRFGSTR